MLNSGKNSAETLFYEAKRYKTHGWSVIPLLGGSNLHDLKRPAIKWGRYQHTHPEVADLENWFLESGFGGLGIVCGRVSKLVVLDFDDPQKASEFRRLHPHLTRTRIIESGTRHLPHYYYHIPHELSVHSRSVPGADFRADGAYVVAPPTGNGSVQWRVLDDVPLHTLSVSDLKAIWRFLASPVPQALQNGSKSLSELNLRHSIYPSHPQIAGLADRTISRRNSDAFGDGLLALYKDRLDLGRNNALFEVACIARDQGVGKAVVIQQLAVSHALQPAQDGSRESFEVRHAEALSTIESAFKRQPRPRAEGSLSDALSSDSKAVGIPTPSSSVLLNSMREWLLTHAHVAAARVLDGLLMAGVQAGAVFTERQACLLLQQYRIGRRSILTALKTLLPDGKPLFEKVAEPLHTSPTSANAAISLETGIKKCDLVRGANRVKTSGRPSTYYRLPDSESLARRIGLTTSPADALSADDLASPKTYRRALHRELIKRRPGSYSRGWLAERLGVSKWTSRRYEAGLNIVVHPMYIEQPLRWTNVESIVPRTIEDVSPGTFLETQDGKRYPPLRAIAMRLLDTGHKVVHKTRTVNHYTYGNSEAVGIPTPSNPAQTKAAVSLDYPTESKDSYSHLPILSSGSVERLNSYNQAKPQSLEKGVGIPTPTLSDTQHSALSTQHSFWLCPSCLKTHIAVDPPETCARCAASDWERVPDAIWHDQERLKVYWQMRWREKHPAAPRSATPLVDPIRRRNSDASRNIGLYQATRLDPESEGAAQRVHECVPGLSRINALRLVSRYGIQAVGDAINRLAHRGGIRNPAGFLVSLLKSEHLFHSRKVLQARPHPLEDAAVWVQHMAESAFVDFLLNADEFIDCDKSK